MQQKKKPTKNKFKFKTSTTKQMPKDQQFSFQLTSKTHFSITGKFEAFTEERKQIIKKYEGQYNSMEKAWVVPLSNKSELKQKLQLNSFQINDIPDFPYKLSEQIPQEIIIKHKKDKITLQFNKSDKYKTYEDQIPEDIKQKLYDFQKISIQQGLLNFGRILIGDEMGIGKTVQSLCLSLCYREQWPLLVICPSSLRLNWKSEILNWIPNIQSSDIQVISKGGQNLKNKQVYVISYDLSTKYIEDFEELNIRVVIVDEAHYLKNPQAQRTQALYPFLMKILHVILLSGTPAFARPKELYILLAILRPDILSDFTLFGNRYCEPKPSYFKRGLDYDGSSNSKELHYILTQNLMIRRLKKDVLQQLPPKRRQIINIEGEKSIVKEINAILNQYGKQDISELMEAMYQQNYEKFFANGQDNNSSVQDQTINEKSSMLAAFNKCYLLTGQAKIKGIQSYINEILENDIKFIFFAHHIQVLDEIEQHLALKKVKSIRIDGTVNHEQRHKRVEQFQNDDTVRVAVLSLTAAGVGLTLTACSNIIFGEMHMTPAIMLQAEDRAHRIGQANSVNCHYIIGQETLDQKLYQKLQSKLETTSQFLDGTTHRLDATTQLTKLQQQQQIEKKTEQQKKVVKGMKTLENYFQPIQRKKSDNLSNNHAENEISIQQKENEKDQILDGLDVYSYKKRSSPHQYEECQEYELNNKKFTNIDYFDDDIN